MTKAEGTIKVFDREDGAKVVYAPSLRSDAVYRAQRRKSSELRWHGFKTALAIGKRELKRALDGEW